jgi:hypothetical protein
MDWLGKGRVMYQMGRRPAFDLVTNEQQFKEGREAHTVFYDERLIHNRHIEDRICSLHDE